MRTGRLPLHLSACLALAALTVGLLAVPSALADGAPTISSFSPTCGPVGTPVDINGNNFQGTTQVDFNGVVAASDVRSGHLIKTTVPTGATTGKIGVLTDDGSATSQDNFTVSSSCAPTPTISSFSPASGPVGSSVTINGTGLSGATAVKFGGVAASTFSVNSSGTQITATVPTGAVTGKISVTTPGGTANSATNFKVTPVISGFSPPSGPVGTVVTINGTGLTGATSVKFGSASAGTFSVNSSGTQITATVPSGAVTGKITVTTAGGTATSATDFIVTTSPAPTISSFSPTSGPVGTSVTIFGSNFTGVTAVKFGGVSASSFSANPPGTQITATVPSGAVTGKITVTAAGGTATSATNFTVTTTPSISSFSPTSGPVGTSVRINGSGFGGATAVRFNGVSASPFTVNTQGTRIDTKVPSGATTGRITVTTPGGTATSATNFTVTAQAPTVTSFSPTSGRAGTTVTITGTNFTGATAVRFGGVSATSFAVNSATQITATVPVGAVTGKIGVTTSAGTGTSATVFTVLPTFHQRSISISLRRHLVVRGAVSVVGGFDPCAEDVAVRIQRFVNGGWRTIATTLTNDEGAYRVRVADRSGRYRSLAPRETEGSSDICGRAVSRVAFNR